MFWVHERAWDQVSFGRLGTDQAGEAPG